MKGNVARITQVVLFVTALCISMASPAKAEGPACSQALAAGTYANSVSGVVAGLPFAAVELSTIDAAGNFTTKQTASWNGTTQRATLTGKITVNADCTGTGSWSRYDESGNLTTTGTMYLVSDDDMREVRYIVTSHLAPDGTPVPATLKAEGRKVFPRSSDQQ